MKTNMITAGADFTYNMVGQVYDLKSLMKLYLLAIYHNEPGSRRVLWGWLEASGPLRHWP